MRRYSQKHHLVTLSDINITPLLDLAFVLLIIFVITTPLLEKGINVQLPGEGKADPKLKRSDIRVVEVDPAGTFRLEGKILPLDAIEQELVAASQANPNLVIFIRADQDGPYKWVAMILNRCERNNLTRVSLRTDPSNTAPGGAG